MIDFFEIKLKPETEALYSREFLNYLKSTAFKNTVRDYMLDHEARARIAIRFLAEAALNPSFGTKLNDFVSWSQDAIEVKLGYHSVPSMLGRLVLSTNSAFCSQIIRAIEENLASDRFKAAVFAHRIEKNSRIRGKRRALLYKATYGKAYSAALAKGYPLEATADLSLVFPMTVESLAKDARDEVRSKAERRTEGRLKRLQAQTASAYFKGNYADIMIRVVAEYIAPRDLVIFKEQNRLYGTF